MPHQPPLLRRLCRRTHLWGLVCGLTLAVAQLFSPASLGTAQAATTTCTPNGATQNCTVTFAYAGAAESWTVPASVTQATFDLYGAQGGDNSPGDGQGGRVTATLNVTPGTTYQILVGGFGVSPHFGFNGGGIGNGGRHGGGASDVRNGAYGLANRILVAGGGGGGNLSPDAGGSGGYPNGGNSFGGSNGGRGGTQTAGGAAGSSVSLSGAAASNGSLGQGGSGYAGGGGGYYGGGGGGYEGSGNGFAGGGGSSFGPVGATFQNGVSAGDGLVTISYSQPLPDTTAPVANPTQSPAAAPSGWNNTAVTVTWNWSDPVSGGAPVSGIDPANCTTSSVASGSSTITVTATCKDLAGNTGTASYSVRIDPTAPNPNPSQSPAANGAGWNNTDVTVNWNWTITGAIIDTANCTTSSTSSGEGTLTLSATCKDVALNQRTATYTVKVDKTAPLITGSRTPPANGNGWNNSAVTVAFTCQEQGTGSGVATNTLGGATVSTQGANQAVTNTGACVDMAGNAAAPATVSGINIDLTKPTISTAATTQPNANGWYNSDVTVHFTCADALSGIGACPNDQTLSSEGTASASSALTASDKADNVSAASNVVTVKIDKTAPSVLLTGVSNGATYNFGSVPTAGCRTTDALAGVATQATFSTSSGTPTGPTGATTVTATCSGATDLAGNSTAPTSVSYTVNALINSSVSQQSVNAVYNATPQNCPSAGGSLPQQTITPTLRNTTSATFSGLFFRVKIIEYTTPQSGQPVLCNATSGNGGVGSTLTIPNSNLPGGNSQFNPGENLTPTFQIGLPVRAQYRFFVDLYAVGAAAATDDATATGEYLGSFAYTFDETAPEISATTQLFLPLINR